MPTNTAHEAGSGLPVFRSPLVNADTRSTYERASSIDSETKEGHDDSDAQHQAQVEERFITDHPIFHKHSEATNIELFYDLFFVANLTVFTNVKEVNDRYSLAQYAGFFTLLWFTWYQVGLYDVRFSMDSVFERICKACHFGVLIGFAIVGPNFNVGEHPDELDTLGAVRIVNASRSLTLFLMADRLILVLQYLQSMWFTKGFRRAILPMAFIALVYFIAAMIYLGLFFTFKVEGDSNNHTYITWYVVSVVETILATTISSVWRVISFKGTHLVQRMSLLTLIILGEGIMGLAKQCQGIATTETFKFSASVIAYIACGVLILYFLYQLYFDWIEEEHFGSIRQQIWSFLHFPLHLFLVAAVEGITQSLAWRLATDASDRFDNAFTTGNWLDSTSWDGKNQSFFNAAATQLEDTANTIVYDALLKSKKPGHTFEVVAKGELVTEAINYINATNFTSDVRSNAAYYVYTKVYPLIYEIAGFEPPERKQKEMKHDAPFDPNDVDSAATLVRQTQEDLAVTSRVFRLVFIYFLVAIGLVVIFCTLIAALSKRHKSWQHTARLAATFLVGLGLALLATIAATYSMDYSQYTIFDRFTSSAWYLPTVLIALFVIIVLNSVRWSRGKKHPQVVKMHSREEEYARK